MNYLKSFKSITAILVLTIVFAACKGKNETRDIQLLTDSTAYLNHNFADTSAAVAAEADENKNDNKASSNNNPRTEPASTGNTTNTNSSENTGNTGTATTQGTEKKGWSKAAQGAVIGGAAGAVGGAIISKKKGKGAVIGAAAGAAGGYIIGREKDKKDGRVKQKN